MLYMIRQNFGCVELSSVDIRTSSAADLVCGSSPVRQIISASKSSFSSVETFSFASDKCASMIGSPAAARL